MISRGVAAGASIPYQIGTSKFWRPASAAVGMSGEDGIALLLWDDLGLRPTVAIDGMVVTAAILVVVFLRARRPAIPLGVCLVALAAGLAVGETHAVQSLDSNRDQWRDFDWIDRTVGRDARVVALWATRENRYRGIEGLWADEFFNRSVRDVASADGQLPDGIPVETIAIGPGGCLRTAFPSHPRYAVLETRRRLTAPVVAVSPSGRSVLYRLEPKDACFAHFAR